MLTVSVVSWRRTNGEAGYCAVRQGVLSVQGGQQVAIATRQAQLGSDLEDLEASVLAQFRADAEAESSGRVAAVRLHTQAIRRIVEALRPRRQMEINS